MLTHTVNPYAAELYCDLRASFRLVDKTAASDATPAAANYDTDVSQIAQTHNGTEQLSGKYATLETGGWPLDGSCEIMPDSVAGIQTGFWSALSGTDGNFSPAPTLTFQFTNDHSSYGFTLLFDDAANWYPKSITLAAYDSEDVLIDSATVDCSSARQVIVLPVSNYRKIVLMFNSTNQPYQRVHLAEVVFGIVEFFDKSNTTQGTLLCEADPRGKALPSGELVLTIDNSDARYNMRSPNSLYAYLQKGQPIDVEIGLGEETLEYIGMGRFYFAKSKASDSSMTAEITAYDLIYQMDKGTYRKGVFGTDTVANLISAVLSDSGLGLAASIPADIGARVIGGNIPLVSHREAIRMIAEAAQCTAFINRSGELQLSAISSGASVDILDGDNMVDWPNINVDDAVNTVDVSVCGFAYDTLDTVQIANVTANISGTQSIWVQYSGACGGASASVSGGTLNSAAYYLYGAELNITASGAVTATITGYEMSLSNYVYTANNITGDETVQSYEVDNDLIVSTEIASAVAAYQLGISRAKYPVTEMGNPARELVDTVTISDAYGGAGDAVVTKEKYTFDGGLSCELEAVG